MSVCNGLFRNLLTIVLTVAVPVCCCNFHGFLIAHAGLASPANALSITRADRFGQEHDTESCHHHDVKLATTSGDHLSSSAVIRHNATDEDKGENKGENKGSCGCGKHDLKMLSTVKSSVEFSAPVLLAALPWSSVAILNSHVPTRVQFHGERVQNRPPTTLLRLHCALIV